MRPWLIAFALLIPALPASADTLTGTRGEVRDRGHTIELRLHRGHAVLVVRRTFENMGVKHDQAVLDIDAMPNGAVATGLRTLGSKWFDGELLDAEVAAARYKYFTGIGGYYPKDPALLSWRSADHLKLQVFPIDPKGQKTIEYTLEAPAAYSDGRYRIELPEMGTSGYAPFVTIRADDPKDSLFLDGIAIKNGDAHRLSGLVDLALAPHDPPKLGGRFASVGFAKGRALLHSALEVAPKLSELPKGAYVVVLMDTSRSVSGDDRAAEFAATNAYLANLPDAKVVIVPFDRAVHPLHTTFVAQPQALDDLRNAKLTPRNGSDFDVALADALTRLDQAPAGAPRRVLVLTDLATRSTLLPSKVKTLDSKKAIIHFATMKSGSASLARDDYDAWSEVPRATGGVLWKASASNNAKLEKSVFEEWARPLRIDRLTLTGVGVNDTIPLPDSLAEGGAFEDLRLHSFPTPALEIRGELWSTKVSTVLTTNPTEERLWSALVFGSDVLDELTEKEMTTLAFRGHAVSPMTSFLAIEPGVRPSTEGLEEGSGFGSGGGRVGMRRKTKVVYMMSSVAFDYKTYWRTHVSAIAASCGANKLHARMETTRDEIVSVEVQPASACVTNGIWELALPADFSAAWQKWEVDVDEKS